MSSLPVIMITGASSGIGEATARIFGEAGYRVVLAARRFERLISLAEEIRRAGGEALPVPVDIAHLDQIEGLVHQTIATFGQIDVLFNNAGLGRINWLEDLEPKTEIDRQIQINLLGLIHTSRIVLPHMIQRRKGHIINMVSIAGLIAPPTYSVYAASKFGVSGFTQALRREAAVFGIEVSGIYPGGVATEFDQHMGRKPVTGVTTPGWLQLSAEQVAQEVWRIVRRPRRTIVIPRIMWLPIWLNTIAPGLIDLGIRQFFTRKERET